MKKSLVLLMVFSALVFGANAAFALPTLQLDIAGGTYNSTDETIYANGNPFDVYALVDAEYLASTANNTFYLSVAVTPKTSVADFGSFSINQVVYSVANNNMQYGNTPAYLAPPQHPDFYPTYYAEISFKFDPANIISGYNTATGQPDANQPLVKYVFNVDILGLSEGYALHFDLYNKDDEFAPFSHDAQSRTVINNPVPEPATLLLLGAGLLGLLGFGRKLRK